MQSSSQFTLTVLLTAIVAAGSVTAARATDAAAGAEATQSASKYVLHIEGMT